MTLGRKIILRNVGLVLAVGLLAASSLWGLIALRREVAHLGAETSELRHLLMLADELTQAKSALAAGDLPRARDLLQDAEDDSRGYGASDAARLAQMHADLPEYYNWDQQVRDDVAGIADLTYKQIPAPAETPAIPATQAATGGAEPAAPADPVLVKKITKELNPGISRLRGAVHDCERFMSAAQSSADWVLQISLILVGGLSALILSCAILLSQWHYQSVMAPLDRLRQWVRRVGGAGEFPPPMEISGDLEFCELTVDVNQMAKELHDFYRELDLKVQQTSRDLVRSQRLASVGFLAAGVAHEINNPLNIMTGYAELTINRMARGYDPAAAADAQRALEVIREEAFRCKQITTKLLSMARGGGENRETFSLRQMSREVAGMMEGLSLMRERRLELKCDSGDPLEVLANFAEIKQVLINLLMNALEAVKPGEGCVTVDGKRDGDWVELSVRDNGRGMVPATLERVFEPFFTEKRGAGEPGTGLGLCISHAIIESHGGKLLAASEGLELGSVFTIRLPAAPHEEADRAVRAPVGAGLEVL
jgi:two-component system, NtrC family, sensor kinase